MIYLVTNSVLPDTDKYTRISVKDSLSKLNELRIVGFDTETSGIEIWSNKLLLVQLGCKEFQVVIDCNTIDIKLYKEFFESDRIFIGWNLKFDIKWLLKEHIVINKIYDMFTVEKLLWLGFPSGMHSMSLKSACENYLGLNMDKSVRGKIIWYYTLSDDIIVYAAGDVEYLEDIMNAQKISVRRKDLTDAVTFENYFVPICAYFEYCGVKLDSEKWKRKMENDEIALKTAQDELNNWVCTNMSDSKYVSVDGQGDLFSGYDLTPKCNINWNSPKQLIEFFEGLGYNLSTKDKKTGEEKKSVEIKILQGQPGVSKILEPYSKYSAAQKVVSTYGQNVLDQINSVTHRIHTNFNAIGTDTSRLSSGGKDKEHHIEYLNFQNFPSDKETRSCFIAEGGYKWISCDYSQQESRILASLSNDKAMLDLFITGCQDTHSLVAKMSYPDIIGDTPVEEVKEKFHNLRQEAKGIEFAINYGGSEVTIKNNKNIPLEEAKKIYDNYMKGFPGIKEYQDKQRKFVMDNGFIILNDKLREKAFIYDYPELQTMKASFTQDFWEKYKDIPRNGAGVKVPRNDQERRMTELVHQYFKRKSSAEKQAIDYKCQGTGSAMFKSACMFLWNYLIENDLLFKVKFVIPAHDEINIEVPEEITDKMSKVLQDCMMKAGHIFCKNIEFPAEAEIDNCWVH